MYESIGLGYLFSHIKHRQQTADHTKPLYNLYYKWHTIKDLVMTPLIAKDAIFRQPFSPVNTRVYTAIIPVKENTDCWADLLLFSSRTQATLQCSVM